MPDPVAPAAPLPRDAATVVIVREGQDGLELFCVERSRLSGFMAGAVVFPGGKVDGTDRDPLWDVRATPLRSRAQTFGADVRDAVAFAVAALRETLEEAAILPVHGDSVGAAQALQLRTRLVDGGARSFGELLDAERLLLDAGRIEPLARWITPTAEPKRFDTRFYLLPLPPGQEGAHDEHETTQSFWATPRRILERWVNREIFLAPPTAHTIELLGGVNTVADAVAIARSQPLTPICPFFTRDGDDAILTMPGDPLHPEPSEPPRDPDAPTRFVLVDGRFVAARA